MFQVSVYDGVPLYLTAIVEIGAKQDLQQRIMVDIISLRGPSLLRVLQPYLYSHTTITHMHKYFTLYYDNIISLRATTWNEVIIYTLYRFIQFYQKWNVKCTRFSFVSPSSFISVSYQLVPTFAQQSDCHQFAVSRVQSFHAVPRLTHSPRLSSTPSTSLTVMQMTTKGKCGKSGLWTKRD